MDRLLKGSNNSLEQKDDELSNLRNRREEYAIEIRSDRRNKDFNKLRRIDNTINQPSINEMGQQQQNFQQNQQEQSGFNSMVQQPGTQQVKDLLDLELREYVENCLKRTYTLADFNDIVICINSEERMKKHYGVIGLRKILSVEDGPPIQVVIDANLVPRLLEFIKQDIELHLQLEAAWALTNIASGTSHQTQTIIDKGGIPLFVNLLTSQYPEIAEQAIWAIGNIAGDCSVYRDMILKYGGLNHLIKIVDESSNKNTIKHGTWAISNLCRGRPLPKFEQVKVAIPILAKMLITSNESEVLTDAAWAMSYLSDGDEDRIQMVINTNLIPALIQRVEHPYLSIVIPCLRTLGNIVTGNDQQTNCVLNQPKFLETVFNLLNHEKRSVRREACWALSNITAGNEEQINRVTSNQQFIEKLITLMETDVTEISREAAWVLSNASSKGSVQDVMAIIQIGVLHAFIKLLDSDDAKILSVVLEGINNCLNKGKKLNLDINPIYSILEQQNAIEKIEKLQEHENEEVYKKSLKILTEHFELETYI